MSRRLAATLMLALAVAATALAAEPPVRDPMQPFARTAAGGVAAGAPAARFSLTAVLISPTRRVAVVNGRPYVVGEAVDGAEIVAIDSDSVRLQDRGAELAISLGKPGNGRPSVQGEAVP